MRFLYALTNFLHVCFLHDCEYGEERYEDITCGFLSQVWTRKLHMSLEDFVGNVFAPLCNHVGIGYEEHGRYGWQHSAYGARAQILPRRDTNMIAHERRP